MKKTLSIVFIAFLSVAVLSSFAPKKKKKAKSFKGSITYSLSYESSELSQVQLAKMPKSVSVKVMGKMSRVQTVSGPMVITQIDRPDDKVKIMLFEMMDKKAGMTIKDTIPENDSTENYDISIDYSGDTKVIAGYTCKKAVVTFTPREGVDAEEVTVAVFYSDELDDGSSNAENDYKGIPGLLLEFYQVTPKITTKYVATEVKKGGVKELDFFFPSDYKEFKSEEELIKYFQG
jgi:GLPGLI family protein